MRQPATLMKRSSPGAARARRNQAGGFRACSTEGISPLETLAGAEVFLGRGESGNSDELLFCRPMGVRWRQQRGFISMVGAQMSIRSSRPTPLLFEHGGPAVRP